MKCNFSITYKSIDARDGQAYWITDEVATIDIQENSFVSVIDKNGKEFILPAHMVGRIDLLV